MATNATELSEMIFNIIYLLFISTIVSLMTLRRKKVSAENKPAALRVLLAFGSLLIGDIGHVGARLIVFFSGDIEQKSAILGIGSLLEMIGLIFLFIFWTDAWRLKFSKPKGITYYCLIGVGVIGLIILVLPANGWMSGTTSYFWRILRNMPWLIQGLGVSILLFIDAKKNDDPLMKRMGICIFISYFFYMPVIFAGHLVPMLGMLMILATGIYMTWQYTSLRYFYY